MRENLQKEFMQNSLEKCWRTIVHLLFNWAAKLTVPEMETFREELAKMGYKFQFITLAGFHALNTAMFELALAYKERGMAGYSELQEKRICITNERFPCSETSKFLRNRLF